MFVLLQIPDDTANPLFLLLPLPFCRVFRCTISSLLFARCKAHFCPDWTMFAYRNLPSVMYGITFYTVTLTIRIEADTVTCTHLAAPVDLSNLHIVGRYVIDQYSKFVRYGSLPYPQCSSPYSSLSESDQLMLFIVMSPWLPSSLYSTSNPLP